MMELKLLLPKQFLPCVRIYLANVCLDSRVSKVGRNKLAVCAFSFCKEHVTILQIVVVYLKVHVYNCLF